jgi:hypothetical protein
MAESVKPKYTAVRWDAACPEFGCDCQKSEIGSAPRHDRFRTAPCRIIEHITVHDGGRSEFDCLRNRPWRIGIDGLGERIAGDNQGKQVTGKKNL